VSSGATTPARAPASIDMLHTVMRPSIESEAIALPRYSRMWPMPPPVPIVAMIPRIRSFGPTPAGSSPSTVTAIVRGLGCGRVWVASTCSTWLVPIPKASAPNAPWVLVCESPHAMTSPGCVSPICGPITCTMPWPMWPVGYSSMPNSEQLRSSACIWRSLTGSVGPGAVGTLWSIVATVRSGRRTVRPAIRRPSNAWGLVTSWTRWRST